MTTNNKNNLSLAETLHRQLSKLPKKYVTALLSSEISNEIEQFLEKKNIQAEGVRTDIVMLLIGIESYEKFPEVVIDEYKITEDEAYKLRDFVNNDLYNNVVEMMSSLPTDQVTTEMPVPPPPPAPSVGYGGTSDPYREPTDN